MFRSLLESQDDLPEIAANSRDELALKPTWKSLGWLCVYGMIAICVLSFFGGAAKTLNYSFPVLSVLVGIVLYVRNPVLYVCFTWWIWFIASFVRRLADWQSGYTSPSLILLAPFLVTLVSGIALVQGLPKARSQGSLPFVLALSGTIYGLLIGLIKGKTVPVMMDSLQWVTPVLLGFYIFVNWRDYPSYRVSIQKTFVWMMLISGCYGIYQYLIAPSWDQFWLINIIEELDVLSFGRPEPMQIRVWSIMNGPLEFAIVVYAGLLICLSSQGTFGISAMIPSLMTFLLTQVRTAWIGWVFGVFFLFGALKPKLQIRLIGILAAVMLCIIPATMVEPFSIVIQERVQSMTASAGNDGSAAARKDTYQAVLSSIGTNYLGFGIGNVPSFGPDPLDSAILEVPVSIGWLGSALYGGGWLWLVGRMLKHYRATSDVFMSTCCAITIGSLPMLPIGPIISGSSGTVLWFFLGLALAAQKYTRYRAEAGYITT